jgi:hypothetical protein
VQQTLDEEWNRRLVRDYLDEVHGRVPGVPTRV